MLQRTKSGYAGGSFRRASAAGLPTSNSRVIPLNDEAHGDAEAHSGGGLSGGAMTYDGDYPVIEATAIATQDDDMDEDFRQFIQKKEKSVKEKRHPPDTRKSFSSGRGAPPASMASSKSTRNLTKAWPPALRKRIVDRLRDGTVDGVRADKYLAKYNWPRGLRDTIARSCAKLPLRFFLVDDSGTSLRPILLLSPLPPSYLPLPVPFRRLDDHQRWQASRAAGTKRAAHQVHALGGTHREHALPSRTQRESPGCIRLPTTQWLRPGHRGIG